MAKKMYYSEEEAAEKLGCSPDELAQYVTEEKIRVFKDGVKNMYNADEVDALAGEGGGAAAGDEILLSPIEPEAAPEEEIELTLADAGEPTDAGMDTGIPLGGDQDEAPLAPSDSAAEDVIELVPSDSSVDAVDLASEAEDLAAGDKDDTAIAVEEGESIFDTGDFEVETADAMTQTQLSPSLEEQLAMEGVGSGSGLLDLTRESDDTSLGAEILEHIDAEADEAPELIEEAIDEDIAALGQPTPPVMVEPIVVEEVDAMAGLFGGILVGCAVVAMLIAGVALASMAGYRPAFVTWMGDNALLLIVICVGLMGVGALVGFMTGKSAADRQAAIRRAGG
ncbi:MAG: helix-turn-helix domain-containing protein [Planctomycetota bacterium]|jgi:hypothetical protein